MRRILRIWPLYYLIITSSYLLINTYYSFKTFVLCLSIFPNLAVALKSGWPSSPQIWSIGVEEQFYLFWPLFLSILPDKKVIISMCFFFVFFSIFPNLFGFINKRTFQNEETQRIIHTLFGLTKFNCMAVGSIMGYALATEKAWIKKLSKDSIVLFLMITSFSLWFFNFELKYFNDEFYAIIFSLMIVGIVNANKINIDTKISRFLGKISYGIYMYHWMIILVVLKYLKYNDNQPYFNCILYSTVFIATIVVSWISHITIEKYFLNLKNRFKS